MRLAFLFALAFFIAQPSNTVFAQTLDHQSTKQALPNPRMFAVPDMAFKGAVGLNQVGGGIGFVSKSFSKWLDDTGEFGALVALHDKRMYPSQLKIEHRICDLAYVLVYKKYTKKRISYRDEFAERDNKIAQLIEIIKTKRQTKIKATEQSEKR